ncbi:hypothetical protein BX600DRAFT_437080 [Xylariales sp. PMI_506]|nr:hypothetical protein BX600DRAFT_437080 [Xylariales sp. PMI_506]
MPRKSERQQQRLPRHQYTASWDDPVASEQTVTYDPSDEEYGIPRAQARDTTVRTPSSKYSHVIRISHFTEGFTSTTPARRVAKGALAPWTSNLRLAEQFPSLPSISLFRFRGWRMAAFLNTTLMSVISLILIILTIVAVVQAGGFNRPLIFFDGACGMNGASGVNTALHVLLNIFSTGVLASSNFFMQVLSSPSRAEIDAAHSRKGWLAIGIISMRNLFRVSPVRSLVWLAFLLSSVPIHLLFNSAVFETDFRASSFNLTLATESFVHGGDYQLATGSSNTTAAEERLALTAKQVASWETLSTEICLGQYLNCNGLTQYGDVVLIVEPALASQNFSTMPIWFYQDCQMSATNGSGQSSCANTCNTQLGGQSPSVTSPEWIISFYGNSPIESRMIPSMQAAKDKPVPSNLTVVSCFAQPVSSSCKVGLSTSLLTAVTCCLVIKTGLCVLVMITQKDQTPLVTLGDAIESFITVPDIYTVDMCLASQDELRMRTVVGIPKPGPRQWRNRVRRQRHAIPLSVWFLTYFVLFLAVISMVILVDFGSQAEQLQTGFSAAFSKAATNNLIMQTVPLTVALVAANGPQLILSLVYLTYNNLWTRLRMGVEWSQMSETFNGLRVSDPKGNQISTYRLQLPYRYSVPLITLSIVLHLLLSTTVYIFISEGDYYTQLFKHGFTVDPSLPSDAAVSVGLSAIPGIILIGMLIVSFVLPLVFGSRKLPGSASEVGNNSFSISAACHVSPLSKADHALQGGGPRLHQQTTTDDIELQRLTSTSRDMLYDLEDDETETKCKLEKVSQSKLRWGVVDMPAEWYDMYEDFEGGVGHISFGTEQDEIVEPLDGNYYI